MYLMYIGENFVVDTSFFFKTLLKLYVTLLILMFTNNLQKYLNNSLEKLSVRFQMCIPQLKRKKCMFFRYQF